MALLTWAIAACTLLLIVIRPRGLPEAIWAVGGALVLVATRAVSLPVAGGALAAGLEVYAFLAGMLVLAEFARAKGVFDWLAMVAIDRAKRSGRRLFDLVFVAGVIVTALLSNDATAVALTASVAVAMRHARVDPLPYAYICAFVANAASFTLPISNPANFLVFNGAMPDLPGWAARLALPSLVAIGLTYLVLRWAVRGSLPATIARTVRPPLPKDFRFACLLLALATIVLVVVSLAGGSLGYAAIVLAAIVLAAAFTRDRTVVREVAPKVAWGIIPLVGGLFVVVGAIDAAGGLELARHGMALASGLPGPAGNLAVGAVAGLASNAVSNVPVALALGTAMAHAHHSLLFASVIGVNLGPNLAVSGSLATILWLTVLRRYGIRVGPLQFLRLGLLVMPPALAGALLVLAP